MPEYWCRPTYRVPGVVYTDNTAYSQGFGHSFRQDSKPTQQSNMSVRPNDDNGDEGKTLNANTYATRKTIAQGMLDIALLTANASQLRYVLSLGPDRHENYTIMIGLIVTSLVLQVLVGILFLFIGTMNINRAEQQRAANILNNIITLMLFGISILNIVISSFGLGHDINMEHKSSTPAPRG